MAANRGGYDSGKPKGYLTYPILVGTAKLTDSDTVKDEHTRSQGLAGVLLDNKDDHLYMAIIQNKEIRVVKPFYDILTQAGVETKYVTKRITKGKHKLRVKINNKNTVIPVEIRKIHNKKDGFNAIRIRVTRETEGEILTMLEAIRKELEPWRIPVKECMWSQGEMETPADQKIKINKTKIEKEKDSIKRELKKALKKQANKIEDLQDEIASLKSIPVKNAVYEDRRVKEGVIK